jgi:peroxiredoxin
MQLFTIGATFLRQSKNAVDLLTISIFSLVLLSCPTMRAQDAPNSSNDVPPILKIGAQAPGFHLLGVDGKYHSLQDYASSKVLVIIFNCDHCPIAQMYEKRIKELTADYKDRNVQVVVIMGNDPYAEALSEWGHTDLGDKYPEMKIRSAYRHFNFPYLFDGDTQAVALKYGPTATPHAFVFDQKRILRYEGRIDSNPREEFATKHYLRDAIDDLLANKPIEITDTPAVGCSTKWGYKEKAVKNELEESNEKPVTVEMVTADRLTALRKNVGTDKLLLVNFWATWCGPCTVEFPFLEEMVRMYAKRQLEIVTVSINNPDEKKFVLEFLQQQHAINRNLLFNSYDSSEAVKAFGTGWGGGAPYLVLIGMDGNVLYKDTGGMETFDSPNALALRRAILKNLPDDRYIGQHAYWNSTF